MVCRFGCTMIRINSSQFMYGVRAADLTVQKKCFYKERQNRQIRYISNTTGFYSEHPSAVTLGKFDGLHRGHQKLIHEILRLQKEGYYGIVFTIAPEHVPALLTPEEKRDVIESFGIDCTIRCPFIPEVLSMEPEAFVADILVRKLNAKYVVVGTDFRFGHKRSGDVNLLKELQSRYGFTLIVHEKECYGTREISSTYVREALAVSDMELAAALLGTSYPVHGVIQHGKKLGRRQNWNLNPCDEAFAVSYCSLMPAQSLRRSMFSPRSISIALFRQSYL